MWVQRIAYSCLLSSTANANSQFRISVYQIYRCHSQGKELCRFRPQEEALTMIYLCTDSTLDLYKTASLLWYLFSGFHTFSFLCQTAYFRNGFSQHPCRCFCQVPLEQRCDVSIRLSWFCHTGAHRCGHRPTHYDLTIKTDLKQRTFEGKVEIE